MASERLAEEQRCVARECGHGAAAAHMAGDAARERYWRELADRTLLDRAERRAAFREGWDVQMSWQRAFA